MNAKQTNKLLLKNHDLRLTGSKVFLEANACSSNFGRSKEKEHRHWNFFFGCAKKPTLWPTEANNGNKDDQMRTATGRIDKLEHQFGIAKGKPGILLVVSAAAWRQPLRVDTCVTILRECGFVPTGAGIDMVDLIHLPEDLSAEELERFLREHGEVTQTFGGIQKDE